jgi:hypothetical protein
MLQSLWNHEVHQRNSTWLTGFEGMLHLYHASVPTAKNRLSQSGSASWRSTSSLGSGVITRRRLLSASFKETIVDLGMGQVIYEITIFGESTSTNHLFSGTIRVPGFWLQPILRRKTPVSTSMQVFFVAVKRCWLKSWSETLTLGLSSPRRKYHSCGF